VLSGAGLGNDARRAQALGKERLTNRIINLVCTGMIQGFPFEVDPRSTTLFTPAFSKIHG